VVLSIEFGLFVTVCCVLCVVCVGVQVGARVFLVFSSCSCPLGASYRGCDVIYRLTRLFFVSCCFIFIFLFSFLTRTCHGGVQCTGPGFTVYVQYIGNFISSFFGCLLLCFRN
jgi:hypothetical protein